MPKMFITGCYFEENWSMADGGALFLFSYAVSIQDSQFRRNRVGGSEWVPNGGAIYTVYYTQLNLTNCVLAEVTLFHVFISFYSNRIPQLMEDQC